MRLELLEIRALLTQFLVTSVLDDGSTGTLRDAITQANSTAGADEIAFDANVFSSPQTITLDNTIGQLSITDPLTISGPGADRLAVSGNHASRVFEVSVGVTASLSGLTIRDGLAPSTNNYNGGGIYNAGTLAVSNITLADNSAISSSDFGHLGGGIYNVGTLTVNDSIFSGNSAGGGGGIYSAGSLTVDHSTFSNNSSRNGGGIGTRASALQRITVTVDHSTFSNNSATAGSGGGINSVAGIDSVGVPLTFTLTVSNSVFSGNSAAGDNLGGSGSGGGIYNSGGTLTVSGSTLAGNSASSIGGGIRSGSEAPNVSQAVSDCTISGNSAGNGGGISLGSGSITVSNCTLSGNSAGNNGGGIMNGDLYAFLTVSNCTLTDNSAGAGGGIWVNGRTTVTGCTISNNSANNGGGLYRFGYYASLLVSGCTLSSNSASNEGGGIWAQGTITVNGSTVAGNSANNGGGIWFVGSLWMAQSTLAGNSAAGFGGGIYVDAPPSSFALTSVLTNVTIAANRCNTSVSNGTGGGIWIVPFVRTLNTLRNTIVAGNFNGPTPGATADDVTGTLDTASAYNLIGTGGSGGLQDRSINPINNNQVGVADPGLGQLGDYGGPFQTIPLLAGSPAVSGGSKGLAVAATQNGSNQLSALTTDQRGAGFPRFYNGTVDIGAFESQLALARVTFTVTNADDSGPGSLRQSVQDNNLMGGGNTIAFALPTATTITLSSGELIVIQDVTVNGPGAAQLAVSGNYASRVFAIYGIGNNGFPNTISGLTIKNGAAAPLLSGGGIYMDGGGALVITNSAFSGNSADSGGGIFKSSVGMFTNSGGGTLSVTGSSFTGNSAGRDGGGIFMYFGSLTVNDSTFSGNSAGRNGGGVAGDLSQLKSRNSTFAGNSAVNSGGGIYTTGGGQLFNVTIASNSANIGGGLSGGFNLSNTIVARNNAAVSGPNIFGTATSKGHNLIGYVSGIQNGVGSGSVFTGNNTDGVIRILTGVLGDKVSIDALNPIDPLLAPLGYYGGSTQTMPPLPGSPAIDAGGNSLAVDASGNLLTTDQRGSGFQRVVNGTVDIGAAENQGSLDPANDGVSDTVENAAPNGGDGNGDGILDSQQANVTSLPNAVNDKYVTLQSAAGTSLVAVLAVTNPPLGLPVNATTPVGTFDFQVQGLAPGGTTTVTLFMPTGTTVTQYWKYGPTGWFDFSWKTINGISTGAKFRDENGDGTKDIILTFVDGGRGDDDGIANGVIVDPGAPVFIEPATLLPDGRLLIVGTDGDDKIVVNPGGGSSEMKVTINGEGKSFVGVTEIVIYAYDGNDDVQVAGGISLPTWVYGGGGDDRLKGGAGNDVLLGGDGDDLIVGGDGRDLLIGGLGADRLVGNAADDILIAGTTDHDSDESALFAIMNEWSRTDADFATRVNNLKNGVGPNGSFIVNEFTVHDDKSSDILTGSQGQDWFLFNLNLDDPNGVKDKATDMSTFEALFALDIDFITGP